MSDTEGGKTVVSIASIPLNVSLTARLPNAQGGWLDYSNHEFGVSEIPLAVPLMWEIGDEKQEKAAMGRFLDAISLIQRTVIGAWFDQLDMVHDELKQRGGYRPKPKPIEAPTEL